MAEINRVYNQQNEVVKEYTENGEGFENYYNEEGLLIGKDVSQWHTNKDLDEGALYSSKYTYNYLDGKLVLEYSTSGEWTSRTYNDQGQVEKLIVVDNWNMEEEYMDASKSLVWEGVIKTYTYDVNGNVINRTINDFIPTEYDKRFLIESTLIPLIKKKKI